MIPLQVGEKVFLLEFKHRKRQGARPELYARSPLNAVTVCAIFGTDDHSRPYAAIGTAICVREDRFSRRFGRDTAFRDAVEKCRMLDSVHSELLDAYDMRFPQKVPKLRSSTPITAEARQAKIEEGTPLRIHRAKNKTAPQAAS
jgi:hypothetical protein